MPGFRFAIPGGPGSGRRRRNGRDRCDHTALRHADRRQVAVGTVEAGKLADIIAVPGDPLRDLAVLEEVSFVMLGGRPIAVP